VGPLFALASVVAHVRRPAAVAILAVTLAIAVVSAMVAGDSAVADYFLAVLLIVTAWLVGHSVNLRIAYIQRLEQEQGEAAQRAAAEERVRIARELHDVVAHHVSSMVVQAEAAAASDGRSAGALDGIANTGRAALDELRRLLGVLRSGADAPLAPQPGLADIDGLAEPLRQAGIAVDVRRATDGPALPPGVELCAYRIVQEALTNVLRHARATHASVTVRDDGDVLAIEVLDDGIDAVAGPGGHGLTGIDERVDLYGGTLDAGPQAGGGFAVRARLPLAGAR
jgi:signal transduction histidine kinase